MSDETKREFSRDSISNTLVVAIGVSLVCSVLVSAAAVVLRPAQERNQAEFRQQIVLEVAGLYDPEADVAMQFDAIDAYLVDLETGDYVDGIDPESFDIEAATNDPKLSVTIPANLDVANLRRRPIYSPVYLVAKGGDIEQIILPVHGAGLWSTMRGYLSVEADGKTVRGLRFYEHAETPGLGDQIDKESWLSQFPGKFLFDEAGNPRFEVVRGMAPPGPDAAYQVDGMSGATLTGNGVTNLIQYWTGSHGFGPYLNRINDKANGDG
jgi:Na+-transporting NADH:ubiquinone oxidoreductase subunit C